MRVAARFSVAILVLVVVFVSEGVSAADPGFGTLRKRKIPLQVRRPAVVRLATTSVAFTNKVANKEYTPVVGTLQAMLETELLGNERTLVKKSQADADWTIDVTVTGFSIPQPQRRTEPQKNKPALVFQRWTGSLAVAYQVIGKDGAVKDADNVSTAYDREFQMNQAAPSTGVSGIRIPVPGLPGAPKPEKVPQSAEDVKQAMVADVVQKIATNLGNTVQLVEAQVAAGDDQMDRAATFLEQKLWARAVEELEKTPVYPKPDHESYRQYDLGLAYEAMSYDGRSYNEQRANLFKAQEYYDKAAELNRDQKYFVEVIARVKDSVARYRTLDAMQQEDQKRAPQATRTSAAPPRPTAPGPTPAAPTGQVLTLADVVEMRTAKVPDEQIIEIIRASQVQFGLDKDSAILLSKENVPVTIQNELRKKVGLPLLPAPNPATRRPTPPPPPPQTKPTQAAPPTTK